MKIKPLLARTAFITAAAVILGGSVRLLWKSRQNSTTAGWAPTNASPDVTGKTLASSSKSPLPSVAPEPAAAGAPSASIPRIISDTVSFADREAEVRRLAVTALTSADREALYGFLRQRSPLDADQYGQVVKNLLMDGLCAADPMPLGVGDVLNDIYHDRNQEIVLRDYAVQHIAAFYEQALNSRSPASRGAEAELEKARNTLWEALAETDSSIGGTALLGLHRLSEQVPREFDRERIAAEALRMVRGASTGELSRLTAFQVCVHMDLHEALPLITEAAARGETMSIRISAIAALGGLAGPEVAPMLRGFLEGREERLKIPAEQALASIQLRQNGVIAGQLD